LSSSRTSLINFRVRASGRIVAVTEKPRPIGSSALTHDTPDSWALGGWVLGTVATDETAAVTAIAVAATRFTPL
jgi:hypothetical protein